MNKSFGVAKCQQEQKRYNKRIWISEQSILLRAPTPKKRPEKRRKLNNNEVSERLGDQPVKRQLLGELLSQD